MWKSFQKNSQSCFFETTASRKKRKKNIDFTVNKDPIDEK